MDLQVYLIIVTVFFVSLGSLLFVNRQLRGGKTFEEALAEKRQLTEKLYGTNKKKNATKKTNAGKKVCIDVELDFLLACNNWQIDIVTLNFIFLCA